MLIIEVIDALCRKYERKSKNHSSSYYPETNANILVLCFFKNMAYHIKYIVMYILFSFNITTYAFSPCYNL